jgi:hypothetical protein
MQKCLSIGNLPKIIDGIHRIGSGLGFYPDIEPCLFAFSEMPPWVSRRDHGVNVVQFSW